MPICEKRYILNKKADNDNEKCDKFSFHMLLSLGASGFLFDEFAFGRCNNKNLLKFAEINSRCNVSGACQVIESTLHH